MSEVSETVGAAGIVRTLVPEERTIEVRLGDVVSLPLSVQEPVAPYVTRVRWHFAWATRVLASLWDSDRPFGDTTFELPVEHGTTARADFDTLTVGTGAIVVTAAEFQIEGLDDWFPAQVVQGQVNIVRVLPPEVVAVAGDVRRMSDGD